MKWLVLNMQQAAAKVLIGVIGGYRLFVSPFLGANCRHLPTCSQYVIIHGPLRGSFYALKRILRCHPWAEPMLDPVPLIHDVLTSAKYVDSKNQRLGE